MSLDELDRVARERLIGSPPHSFQLLGTMERLRYVEKIGTMGVLGTVLLTVHIGTLHKVDRMGTLDEMTRAGTLNRIAGGRIGTLGRLGTVHYQGRLGTVQSLGTVKYLGTVRYLQAGSLGRVEHLGTVGRVSYLSKIGTVSRIGTAHAGTVPVELARRQFTATVVRDRVRLGPGSIWVGSWLHVGSYKTKTVKFDIGNPGTSGGGSIAIVMGLAGTTQSGMTGTYYGPARIGKGTPTVISWAEAMRYARPWIRQHGGRAPGTFEHGGTVSFGLALHV